MDGSLAGTDSWFANPASQVSAHYGVGLDGSLHQYVELTNCAWANGILEAGNLWPGPPGVNPNYLTVSVETEDLGDPNQEVTDQEYFSTRYACQLALQFYPQMEWLMGHSAISPSSRANCCGDRWVSSGRMQSLAIDLGLELIG